MPKPPEVIPYDPDWQRQSFDRQPASDHMVKAILDAPTLGNDGRSPWFYIRLPCGNLVLATYPQGDTYLMTEADRTI